jgi:outer membrane lipoprotein SlyB
MNNILRKLSSRKLWVTIVGIVVGIAAACGITENEYAQIVGLIGAIAAAVNYVHAEGLIDKASAVPIIIEAEETDTDDE